MCLCVSVSFCVSVFVYLCLLCLCLCLCAMCVCLYVVVCVVCVPLRDRGGGTAYHLCVQSSEADIRHPYGLKAEPLHSNHALKRQLHT